MVDTLGVDGGDRIVKPAVRLYEIALDKRFVHGRPREFVQAACLYIACRESNKPFLLIEFSEFLRVNVYVLGAVFLQLCKVLHLQEHPIVQKPVDPSLFIHRFANGLLGERNFAVEKTALRIMASMKLNWMQTGRKPSGLCGAALYISALSYGFKFSKTEIVKIVHVCEATLTKRLIEFEETESGSLTIEEFNEKAVEHEKFSSQLKETNSSSNISKEEILLCEHKDTEEPHFAHGLCKSCYQEFIKISGGLDGGSEPPAFQRAERERSMKAMANEISADTNSENLNMEKEARFGVDGTEKTTVASGEEVEHEVADNVTDDFGKDDFVENDESENLSDIDDDEVAGYMNNEEEQRLKKVIWEDLNREYLQEQAAKEAAKAAEEEILMATFENATEEMLEAKRQADEIAALYQKKKKERRQKRAAEAMTPKTAAEATHQILAKKRVSSKINNERLKELFDEPVEGLPDSKKSRTETEIDTEITNKLESETLDQNEEITNMVESETLDEHEEQVYNQDDSYHDFDEQFDDEWH
ncbi:unnamed protein product [Amaranthus hypochondriacus]